MAAHNKGRQVNFTVGSVTQYCTKHCSRTVLVVHKLESMGAIHNVEAADNHTKSAVLHACHRGGLI